MLQSPGRGQGRSNTIHCPTTWQVSPQLAALPEPAGEDGGHAASPASATVEDGDQQDKDVTMVIGREMIGSGLLGAASVCPGDYQLWNVTGCSYLSHSVGWKEQGLMAGEEAREYG